MHPSAGGLWEPTRTSATAQAEAEQIPSHTLWFLLKLLQGNRFSLPSKISFCSEKERQ